MPNRADFTAVKWGSCQGKRHFLSPTGMLEPHPSFSGSQLPWAFFSVTTFHSWNEWHLAGKVSLVSKYFTTVQELTVSFFIKSEFLVALWLAAWKLLTSLWCSGLITSLLFPDICQREGYAPFLPSRCLCSLLPFPPKSHREIFAKSLWIGTSDRCQKQPQTIPNDLFTKGCVCVCCGVGDKNLGWQGR